jgi:3,4-dihydroxy-2-butanone 4-phosphate synthase
MNDIKLNTIEEGIEDIKNGKLLIVVDDEDRENEGDFICAELITPEIVNLWPSMAGLSAHCLKRDVMNWNLS